MDKHEKKAEFKRAKKSALQQIESIQQQAEHVQKELERARLKIEACVDAEEAENWLRYLMGDLEQFNFRVTKLLNPLITFCKLVPFEITAEEKDV